MITLNDKQT